LWCATRRPTDDGSADVGEEWHGGRET